LLGTAVVDRSGRVRDRTLLTALGWAEGMRLEIRMAPGTAVLSRSADGAFQVDGRDQVVLPAATRALLGITPGQRVVLVAMPDTDLLFVHPVTVAAAWIAAHYLETSGISDEL
jgi:bifunctional DNA-binding transcriptional regulator/antitoxin component of YhaV-PrlF toxin-antitoxin module